MRVAFNRRDGDGFRRVALPARHVPAQCLTAFAEIRQLAAIRGKLAELQRLGVPFRKRQGEAILVRQQAFDVELFGLVRGHARLPRAAHPVALLGLGENDGGPALVRLGRGKRGVKFAEIVTAPLEGMDF